MSHGNEKKDERGIAAFAINNPAFYDRRFLNGDDSRWLESRAPAEGSLAIRKHAGRPNSLVLLGHAGRSRRAGSHVSLREIHRASRGNRIAGVSIARRRQHREKLLQLEYRSQQRDRADRLHGDVGAPEIAAGNAASSHSAV